jgi:putative DNA primase/helicase
MTGSEFAEAMVAAGIDPGTLSLIADGKIHRFSGPGDKPGKLNCWYVLFEHGGAFGSWRLGIQENWYPSTNGTGKLSAQERRRIKAEIDAAQREAKADAKNYRRWRR